MMSKIAPRLAIAAAVASAATFAATSSASAATIGTGSAHVSTRALLRASASVPEGKSTSDGVHPNTGACDYDPDSDLFTCQILTTSWVYVQCNDGNLYSGEFGPGLYTIPSPCDYDWGVYGWGVS